MAATGRQGGNVDKRRLILDAAITVFARRGFHSCRVSDVADEAGVAYGLVYHYFSSKEEILNTLFTERWQLMLDAIVEIDSRGELSARDKLGQVAGFIIDSYRHEPDLMKVIIVEEARGDGSFKSDISAEFAAMCFYGAIEQLLTAWIFDVLPKADADYERAKELVVEAICGGLEADAVGASALSS
jgi:AcrR family transcriptional regulator